MDGDRQRLAVFALAEQPATPEKAIRREGSARLGFELERQLSLLAFPFEVHFGEGKVPRIGKLPNQPLLLFNYTAAQRFVALLEVEQGLPQQREVEAALELGSQGRTTFRRIGLDRQCPPAPFLHGREGMRLGPAVQGRRRQMVAVRPGLAHQLGHLGDGGRSENLPQRQVHPKGRAHLREQLRGEQRMTPEVEKIGFDRHVIGPHDLTPQAFEHDFDLVAGADFGFIIAGQQGEMGQAAAVDLAVWGHRQYAEQDHRRRHHEFRQVLAQIGSQLRPVGRHGGRLRHHEADQVGPTVAVVLHHHHFLRHRGMAAESGLDFPQLDAEAADFHLLIDPADEFELEVLVQAGKVARGVKAFASCMRQESRGSGGGCRVVTEGERGAAEEEFARHPDRRRLSEAIEHAGGGGGDWPPDRHVDGFAVQRFYLVQGGEGGGFGGAVSVHQTTRRPFPQHLADHFGLGPFAAEDHQGKVGENPRILPRQLVETGRRHQQYVDVVAFELRAQGGGVGRTFAFDADQFAAAGESAPDLESHGIEGKARDLAEGQARGQLQILERQSQANQVLVREQYALGLTGRAGGEKKPGGAFRARQTGNRGLPDRGQGLVEQHQVARPRFHPIGDRNVGDERAGLAAVEHAAKAHGGIFGIERGHHRARFEHTQAGGHQIDRTRTTHPHHLARLNTPADQLVGKGGRHVVELAVGPALASVNGRHLAAAVRHPAIPEVDQAGARWRRPLRRPALAGVFDGPKLRRRQQRELGKALVGFAEAAFEQAKEKVQAALHGGAFIKIEGVGKGDRRALLAAFNQGDLEVVTATAHRRRDAGNLQTQQVEIAMAGGQALEMHPEEGGAFRHAVRPQGFDQLFVGQGGLFADFAELLPEVLGDGTETGIAGQAQGQHHQVVEIADQRLHAGRPGGNR